MIVSLFVIAALVCGLVGLIKRDVFWVAIAVLCLCAGHLFGAYIVPIR